MTFSELKLSDPLLKAVTDAGYSEPTPIQQEAIPIVLGGNDLLGCAQTGTGKTAAFALPIIQHLCSSINENTRKRKIRSLIVTPTRELAIQINDNFTIYEKYTKIKNTVIFGGVKQNAQVYSLRNGVDVLIATPGRLLDLINQRIIDLYSIEIFVLDEADRMLDMGFIHDVKKIINLLPKERQSLFFSATMPEPILKLSASILHNPLKVEITPSNIAAETVNQSVYFVDKSNKTKLLINILNNKNITSVLVFTRTKHGADKVVRILNKNNIKAEAIHGNKSQNARQNALNHFKKQTTRVLVATDIAARGIDIENLEYVINYDIPNIPESYVHRIGRTGRAGANGKAYSFCDIEELPYLKSIENLINQKIYVVENHSYLPIHSWNDLNNKDSKHHVKSYNKDNKEEIGNNVRVKKNQIHVKKVCQHNEENQELYDFNKEDNEINSKQVKHRQFRRTDKRKTALKNELKEGNIKLDKSENINCDDFIVDKLNKVDNTVKVKSSTQKNKSLNIKIKEIDEINIKPIVEEIKPESKSLNVEQNSNVNKKKHHKKNKKPFVPREHTEIESNASFDEIEFRFSEIPDNEKSSDAKKWFQFWKK